MDNVTIGILSSNQVINDKVYKSVSLDNIKYLYNKCNYISLMVYDNDEYIDNNLLSKCDGFIIPGGYDIYNYHNQVIEYALNNNKPLLGICMGMQAIGLKANNEKDQDLVIVKNHDNTMHNINIRKDSLLYKLYGDNLEVISRHNYILSHIDSPYVVGAVSDDNVIEEIEYIDREHFILGVLFHIEDMDNTSKIYNYFIKECLTRKENYNTK